MTRHSRSRVAAGLGALTLAAPFGTGIAAADPPVAEVTVERFDGAALVGTVRCPTPTPGVVLSARVTQQGDPYQVTASASTSSFICGTEPRAFRAPLRGSGVFLPGGVGYEVSATVGGQQAVVGAGTFTATTELELFEPLPPESDALPIQVNDVTGDGPGGPIVEGTITCDEPQPVAISVRGIQRAGQHHLPIEGLEVLPQCEGETPFAVPVSSDLGELVPGPATVTVRSENWDDPDAPFGRKNATVTLTSSTPEPDFRPEPTPGSPISFGDAFRIGDTVGIVLTTPACTAGDSLVVNAKVYPAQVIVGDRWFNPTYLAWNRTGSWACDGTEQTHILPSVQPRRADEVAVEVFGAVLGSGSGIFSNQATLPVSTK